MDNHRKHYRMKPDIGLDIDVAVVGSRNRLHPSRILDVSGGGMRLVLKKRMQPEPALGLVLHVVMTSELFPEPLDVPVIVVQADDTDDGQEIGVRFLDWLGLAAVLPAQYAEMFNLRADHRLELDPAVPTQVTIRGLDILFEVHGTVTNVSRGGMSFTAAPMAEAALGRTDLCGLEFTLPGSRHQFSLAARIRHRALLGEVVQYGACFDPQYTQQFDEQQRLLDDYVQKRMRAVLRELAVR